MPRSVYDVDEDDDFDERGLLRDGRRHRVPMQMMDEKFIDDRSRRVAFFGDHADAFVGHRPGYASSTLIDAAAIADREASWQERGRLQRQAWMTPPAPARAEPAVRGHEQRQDARSDLGRPQTAARPSSRSTASPGVFDQEARADADLAWEERGRRMADAWRG